ncbi:MAG: kelch repeat-containing protein [Bacteroidota bacterium]|nr:kelch repeat-containing protein [Bacteroidota bacterium]
MKKFTLGLMAILLCTVVVTAENKIDYGLKFKSYKFLSKDRTGLSLENDEFVKLGSNLGVGFDMLIRKETLFGSIIRIVSDKGNSIILSIATNELGKPTFILLINNQLIPIKKSVDFNSWFNLNIILSNSDRKITLRCDDYIFTHSFPNSVQNFGDVKICFGVSSIPNFITEEVPPMNLRNIELKHNNNLFRSWKLCKHKDIICYDEKKQAVAKVHNPEWLIDYYTKWTKLLSLDLKNSNYPQYTFDPKNNLIYIVPDNNSIIVYNPETKDKRAIPVRGGFPASRSTNQLVFDSENQRLISYSLDEQSISVFSFETSTWSRKQFGTQETHFWHHTAAYWQNRASIVAFGGYGIYRYTNDFFLFSLQDNSWKNKKIEAITKRYSAASTILNDTLFIFSGEGNESGKQEEPSTIFNDLYAIDLKTSSVKQIWKSSLNTYGLPCGNMVYSPKENSFYVMTNKDGGSLIKISKSNPKIRYIISNINQQLEADFNLFTLMKPQKLNKLYVLFCRDYKAGGGKIDLYETCYPPLSKSESIQGEPQSISPILILCAILGIGLIGMVLYLIIHYKQLQESKKKKQTKNAEYSFEVRNDKTGIEPAPIFNRNIKAISLLGGFNVKDKNGNDITSHFTPVLKTILLCTILSSNEDLGISTKIIDSLLWPDKDNKSTRNNRNVSINRLNNVLEEVGDVRIQNEGRFWKLVINDDCFCDYLAISRLMKLPESEITNNQDTVAKLVELLSYGPLVPFTQAEWIDTYKAQYSNFALDMLGSLLEKESIKSNLKLKMRICEIIFLFDSINENALYIKCNALYDLGKKGLAKFSYDNFCKEYESLLGEKYKVPFTKIINN